MYTITLAIFALAKHDVTTMYDEPARFVCVELHARDPLYQKHPSLTVNFERPNGGNPVQWHTWPFRHIEEEELPFGVARFTLPPQ